MKSNVQVMREAARHLLCVIDEMGFKPWCADDPLAIACDKLDAALALPLRNCDVGTAEEQARRYDNFAGRYNPCSYKGYVRCAEDCPVHKKLMQEGHGELLCQLEWAQMPYEEAKGV